MRKFTIHAFAETVAIIQYCILVVFLLTKSQASISNELSKTVRILRSYNLKYSRQINAELEILMLKVLHRNLNDRTSSMFLINYPLIYAVCIRSNKMLKFFF
jgi:hypothetical protein